MTSTERVATKHADLACGVSDHALAPGCPCMFEAVWSRIDAAVLLFELGGDRLAWRNQAAERLLAGLRPPLDDRALRDRLLADVDALAVGMTTRRLQEALIDGAVLGYSVCRISDGHAVVLLRDITEQRRLESIAETANLMENIGYVFGGIRHELGNPINTIKMTLSVLRRDLEGLPAVSVIARLDSLLDEVARVEYLLTNLRGWTIYDAPSLVRLDLRDALERFAHLVDGDLRARNIALAIETDPATPAARADARSLQQVLLNLVTNAADALAGRSAARIRIAAAPHGAQIAVRVSDNGVGMSADQLAHLFLPFRTTKPKGTGLGMVIVQKMLTAMGAQIEVASAVDEGTTMTIILPTDSAEVGVREDRRGAP